MTAPGRIIIDTSRRGMPTSSSAGRDPRGSETICPLSWPGSGSSTVYRLVLGRGKKVFPEGAVVANLDLLGAEPGENGAVSLRYAPAPGPVRTGTMGS